VEDYKFIYELIIEWMYAYARAGNYVDFDVCEYYIYIVILAIAFDKRSTFVLSTIFFVDVTELG